MYEELNQQSAVKSYSNSVLAMWINFVYLGSEYRKMMMQGYPDLQIMIDYLTNLSSLWLIASPFVAGCEKKDLETEFFKYEKYGNEPLRLMAEPQKITPMETVVRRAMQHLKVTTMPT